MEFKKHISVDSQQRTYVLDEPITINNEDRFVKIKWRNIENGSIVGVREFIINCNLISSGE